MKLNAFVGDNAAPKSLNNTNLALTAKVIFAPNTSGTTLPNTHPQ